MEIITFAYDGFDWDFGNIKKAQKHGLSLDEIELFFQQEIFILQDQKHSVTEKRVLAVGMSVHSRSMLVVFTLRSKNNGSLIRVISARHTHKKETELYEKLKKRVKKEGGRNRPPE